jgi:hypothetical protein
MNQYQVPTYILLLYLLGLAVLFGLAFKYNPFVSIMAVLVLLICSVNINNFIQAKSADPASTCKDNFTWNESTNTCDCVSPYEYDIVDMVCDKPLFDPLANKFYVNIYTRYEERKQYLVRSNDSIGLSDMPKSKELWLVEFNPINPQCISLKLKADSGVVYNLITCNKQTTTSVENTDVKNVTYWLGNSSNTTPSKFVLNKRKEKIFKNHYVTIYSICKTETFSNETVNDKTITVGPFMTAVQPTILNDANPVAYTVLPKPFDSLESSNNWYFELVSIAT